MTHPHDTTLEGTRPSPWYRPINAVLAAEVRDFLSRNQRELPAWLLLDQGAMAVRRQVQALDTAHYSQVELPLVREARPALERARTLVDIAPTDGSLALADALARSGTLEAVGTIDRVSHTGAEYVRQLAERHPQLPTFSLTADVTVSVSLPRHIARPTVFVSLGGGINRLPTIPAVRFLRQMRACMRPDDMLMLGLDLRRGAALEAHELGQLALRETWHRHVLTVLNRELQTNFEPERFQYRPQYDAANRRLTLLLEATARCRVTGPTLDTITFKVGERIRTGVVCEYDRASLGPIMRGVGLTLDQWLESPSGTHALVIASPTQTDAGA
ncbi:MAG: L-histidine N(alpha)-methyltransferase [Gemmatimonadaceae bacterium]